MKISGEKRVYFKSSIRKVLSSGKRRIF